MQLTIGDVLDRIIADGLASREAVGRARAALQGAEDTDPPWYARVIAGVGAWIATGCLIGFLVIADIVDGELAAIIVGTMIVAAAVWLRRAAKRDDEFKRQLSLASSLAGQVLVIVGVRGETESTLVAAIVAVAMSVVLAAVVADPAHRFMSALVGSLALVAAMASFRLVWPFGSLGPLGTLVVRGSDLAAAGLVALVAYAWRWNLRQRSAEEENLLVPVGYGAIAALLIVLVFSSWFVALADFTRGGRSGTAAWTFGAGTTIAIAAALSMLVWLIVVESGASRMTAVMPIVLALLTLPTPGIVAAVALLIVGFDRRNRVLIALAVAFLIKFLSMYYYSLRLTLLEKSAILMASGLLLLGWRVYLELRRKPSEGG